MKRPAKIFLSHKTVDKDVVRDFKATLELLGLQAWLDEDELIAGVELHRGLQAGMKESCAAVFFITPSYVEERFLRAEVNYAVSEKTERGDAFAIITLVLPSSDGKRGKVPELLEPYVWKQPSSDLQGLREILRALPLPFRDIRPATTAAGAVNIRVTVSRGEMATLVRGEKPATEDIVILKLENHGDQPVFISGGYSFQKDDTDKYYWCGTDSMGTPLPKRQVPPGDGFSVPVSVRAIRPHLEHITVFVFTDEIGRKFASDIEETRAALRGE
jgi:hypothetical protein